jgi:hypothetical protein
MLVRPTNSMGHTPSWGVDGLPFMKPGGSLLYLQYSANETNLFFETHFNIMLTLTTLFSK